MKCCEYKEYDILSSSVVAENIEAPIVVQQLRYGNVTPILILLNPSLTGLRYDSQRTLLGRLRR